MTQERITEEQAAEFYCDLCETIYGDSNKNCQGIMSVYLIADRMGIEVEHANDFCDAMIKYGITERQGGLIVI